MYVPSIIAPWPISDVPAAPGGGMPVPVLSPKPKPGEQGTTVAYIILVNTVHDVAYNGQTSVSDRSRSLAIGTAAGSCTSRFTTSRPIQNNIIPWM